MSEFKKLVVGEVLSETSFYTVEKVVGDKVQLGAENGESVIIDKPYVEAFLASASQYKLEQAVTRTEMSEIMLKNSFRAITVNFQKQVKDTDIQKEIQEAYENSTPKEFASKMKVAVKKGLSGVERSMVGRHFGHQDEFGRVQFIDMEVKKDFSKATYDTRQRQVDPRTLNWIIVNDIKYVIKK